MSNVPKLRFKEFNGEWSTRPLSSVSLKISDGIHTTPKYDDTGRYYFINGNNLKNNAISLDYNTKRVNEDEYQKHYRKLDDSTVLMSINGTIGNLAFYRGEPVVLGKSACYINLNLSEVNKLFISNQIKTSKVQFHFQSELTGVTANVKMTH